MKWREPKGSNWEKTVDEHERAFVCSFIVPQRRQRYLQLLANRKRRTKILERLNHLLDLDYRFVTPVAPGCCLDALAALLERKGAGALCHVIADASDLDGQDIPLREATWQASVHSFGIVLSCLPGRLAFYKPESPSVGYVLERNQ